MPSTRNFIEKSKKLEKRARALKTIPYAVIVRASEETPMENIEFLAQKMIEKEMLREDGIIYVDIVENDPAN